MAVKPSVHTLRRWSTHRGLLAVAMLAAVLSTAIPIFGMASIFAVSVILKNQKTWPIGALLCLSLVITCASHKIPSGDLENFLIWYGDAANYTFLEYISLQGRETLYHTAAYLMYSAFQGSERVFIFVSALLIYGCLASAATRNLHKLNLKSDLILAIIYLQLLFPPLFNIATQTLRQNIAAGLFFFSLALYREKREWLFWVIGVSCLSIHASAVTLLAIAALIRVTPTANRKTFVTFFAAGLLAFVYGVRFVLPELVSWLGLESGYLVQKISAARFYDLGEIPPTTYIMSAMSLVAYSIAPKTNPTFEMMLRISACIAAIPLLLGWDPLLSELALRLSMYQYFFIWIPLYVFSKRMLYGNWYITIFAVLTIPWFAINLFSSTWQYESATYALIFGSLTFLINI